MFAQDLAVNDRKQVSSGDLVEQLQKNHIVTQLRAMKQRMEALYSESLEGESDGTRAQPEPTDESGVYEPPVNLWESGKGWHICIDLPGVADEDVQVELIEDKLSVRGTRRFAGVDGELDAVQMECPQGAFSRTFILPEKFEEEAIEAQLKQGILTLTIARNPGSPAASQKVQVRVG